MNSRRPRPRPWCCAALLGVLLGALGGVPAAGDVVTTKDGRSYEGRVVSQDDAKVVVETTFEGTKEVSRSDVKSVDTSTPPLRDQLAYRMGQAKADPVALVELAGWAKSKGFKTEVEDVWKAVLAADPKNVKAHKALGHVLVAGAWMTPEEKAAAEKAAEEAALRAKGLVPYQGRWVTPEEKDALEKGLVKDGNGWVTEEVFHTRRGEKKVDGKWIRVGEAEGKARCDAVAKALQIDLLYLWGPRIDLMHELKPEEGDAVLDSAEKVGAAFVALLKAGEGPKDGLDGLRVQVFCAQKAPTYARFVAKTSDDLRIGKMAGFDNWAAQAGKMRSFWWTDPSCVMGQYIFPNTIKVLQSGVAHNLALVLLNRYRFNFRFSTPWLQEGLAYVLEMKTIGYSQSYTVGKAGTPGGGADPTAWQDSAKWKDTLKATVAAGQDAPMSRLAGYKAGEVALADLVKSWSVVDLLVKIDPAKFKVFVDETKAHRDAPEEEALTTAYGLDWRTLEARWRAYVSSGFTAP